MSIRSVMYFLHQATSIKDLAERVYIHQDLVSDKSYSNLYFRGQNPRQKWWKSADQVSAELATYLETETDRRKIAMLLTFLICIAQKTFDLERSMFQAARAKNLNAIVELIRIGCYANTDEVLSHGSSAEIVSVLTIKDQNLEDKYRNPEFEVNRVAHLGAVLQACHLMGIKEVGLLDPMDLFEKAIKENNFRAFRYLVHANFEELDSNGKDVPLNMGPIAKMILDQSNPNPEMLKELTRQGHKLNMKVGSGLNEMTVMDYAVGKIRDSDFGCFFFKTGRFNFDNPRDRSTIERVESRLTDKSVIDAVRKMPPLMDLKNEYIDYSFYDPIDSETKPFKLEAISTDMDLLTVTDSPDPLTSDAFRLAFNDGMFIDIPRNKSKSSVFKSTLLNEMLEAVAEDEEEMIPLAWDSRIPQYVHSFMELSQRNETANPDDTWVNSFMSAIPFRMYLQMFDYVEYIGCVEMYEVLSYWMNKKTVGLDTAQLRYMIFGVEKWSKLNLDQILDKRGVGKGFI